MGQSRDNTWVCCHVPGLSSFNLSVMEVCYCPLQLISVHHEPHDLRPEDAAERFLVPHVTPHLFARRVALVSSERWLALSSVK